MDMGSVLLPYMRYIRLSLIVHVYFESIIERKTTLYRSGK